MTSTVAKCFEVAVRCDDDHWTARRDDLERGSQSLAAVLSRRTGSSRDVTRRWVQRALCNGRGSETFSSIWPWDWPTTLTSSSSAAASTRSWPALCWRAGDG